MAMYLGGGQVIDPSVKVGPDANLVAAAQTNRASQKADAINMLNMFKGFADAQGISMSHMAELFPEQMSFAFDAVTGGNGADMMNKLVEMPVNTEQETRFRNMQKTQGLRDAKDYAGYEREVKTSDFVPGKVYEKSTIDANTPTNGFNAYRNQNLGSYSYEGIPLNQVNIEQSQIAPQMLGGAPIFAQGGSLADYGQQTGDVHRPALVGDQEIVMNKEAVKRFGNVLEQMNQMYPNVDAQSLPSNVGGIPQYADGKEPSYAVQIMNDIMARTGGTQVVEPTNEKSVIDDVMSRVNSNAQRDRVYEQIARQRADAIHAEQARAEMERNAASEADLQEGWEKMTLQEYYQNRDKYDIVAADSTSATRPDSLITVIPKKEKGTAQIAPSSAKQAPYIPGPQTQPSNTPGSNRLHPGGVVPPVDEVVPDPVVPDPTPVPEPQTEAEKLQLRQQTFEKGEVATPAEYETVLDTFGFFPEMDRYHQKIAEIAPGLAQAIPGAKYYADQMAAQSDPSTLLDLQKTAAEITKLQSEAAENIANGNLYDAKRNIEDINAATLSDKNEAEIREINSKANANFALGSLREIQGRIEEFKLNNTMPLQLDKMMAETNKLLKETDFMLDPITANNIKMLEQYTTDYMGALNKNKWLKDNGDAYTKLASAFVDQGYLALSGEGQTGHLGWKQDVPTPSGGVTTLTGGGEPRTADDYIAEAQARAGEMD